MTNKWDQAIAESQLNQQEGTSQSEAELARHFGEALPEVKPPPTYDIYEVSARIKNLAREAAGSLSPVGDVLCNTYTHVVMALYNFSETLAPGDKERLKDLIRANENMPANVIAASAAHVKPPKRRT